MTGSAGTSRRALLTAVCSAAVAVTAGGSAGPASGSALPSGRAGGRGVANHAWASYADWEQGAAEGTRTVAGARPYLAIAAAAGRVQRADPVSGRSVTWEHAVWTGPEQPLAVPSTEAVVSWNAHTPAGTWLRTEVRGTYSDGTRTPWYSLGDWASGDQDIRRASADGQGDGRSAVLTDTLAIGDPASGLRLTACRARLTLHRRAGTALTPRVHRLHLMGSDIPDRFTVPASVPVTARELAVPRYSQNTHIGQYPEYDNGGEAWCSPTSSQMVVEYWGHRPAPEDLAWVDPAYADPQVCHAARATYDHTYRGCGNWPFNAAYAASHPGLQAVVTRLATLTELEGLVAAGLPVITSQSFRAEELTGAGYGTAGHLMTVVGFTADGDVIANDPSSPSNAEVRRVYRRREWENVWLRTRRYNAAGKAVGGSGGVCYLYFPAEPDERQRRALAAAGIG
ncbi:C39 family peptidase [Streptomyces uncialis]|uniref:C39 family peptidase n=1 Tax=Streptomyces uncialis TaxID=1048205 RepID=UPI002E35BE2C|nr:C39 family peptidase [Streptomyces uncialis]